MQMEEELRTRCAASVVRVLGLSEWRFKKKKHFMLELDSSFALEPISPIAEEADGSILFDDALGELELVLFQIKSLFFAVIERKKLKVPLRRRDGWPSAFKEFRRQIILLGFDAPFTIFPNYKFTIDHESVWKLLISEWWLRWYASISDVGEKCKHPKSCVCFKERRKLQQSSPESQLHLGGTSKEKHSFTCYFLYGTVIAHKVKARLPSERGVNYNPGEHILLLDVDNCSKILRFLETYVPPNVDIYGFCAAGYLHNAPECLPLLMEKKVLHLIFAVPATQEETEGDTEAKENEEINPSEVPGLGSKFLSSYYECGAERKYKNSADYVLSMYAGILHTLLPMDVPFWIMSHDDGLDYIVDALSQRGREARKIPATDIIHGALLNITYSDAVQEGLIGSTVGETNIDGRKWKDICDEVLKRWGGSTSGVEVGALNLEGLLSVNYVTRNAGEATVQSSEGGSEKREGVDDSEKEIVQNTKSVNEEEDIEKSDEEDTDKSKIVLWETKKLATEKDRLEGEWNATWNGDIYNRHGHELQMMTAAISAVSLRGIRKISLHSHKFGGDGIELLCEAIKQQGCPLLKDIDLRGNKIGNRGAIAVAALLSCAIPSNPPLKRLDIRANKIKNRGCVALAEGLHVNNRLVVLDLRINKIGLPGARALCEALKVNTTLTTLVLRNNPVGMEGVLCLCDALISRFGMEKGLSLRTIDVRSNVQHKRKIGDSGAEVGVALSNVLKLCEGVTSLDLCANKMDPTAIYALSQALHKNASLTRLGLDFNPITAEGVPALSQALVVNQTLTVLTLANSRIGDIGACALARALCTNVYLTQLDLQKNEIGDLGAMGLALALKRNPVLTQLTLDFNNIADAGCLSLSAALICNNTLTALEIGNNRISTRGGIALAAGLEKNSSLTWLHLSGNTLGDDGMAAILKAIRTNPMSQLIHLEASQVDMRGEGYAHLALLYKEHWEKHKKSPTQVDLSFNPLGAEISSMKPYTSPSNPSVSRFAFTSTSFLEWVETVAGPAGIMQSGVFPDLTPPKVRIPEMVKPIDEAQSQEYSLSSDPQRDEDYFSPHHPAGFHLHNILVNSYPLISLDLMGCNLTDKDVTSYLAPGLAANSTLTKLELKQNKIGTVGVSALRELLQQKNGANAHRVLIYLSLHSNSLHDSGIKAFAKCLKTNQTLTYLSLENNQITNKGVRYLSKHLEKNRVLTTLSLPSNQIGDEGLVTLSEALGPTKNETLLLLNVERNPFSPKGAEMFWKGVVAKGAEAAIRPNAAEFEFIQVYI